MRCLFEWFLLQTPSDSSPQSDVVVEVATMAADDARSSHVQLMLLNILSDKVRSS